MKIYDVKGFPNPTRVRIALAEKGLSDKVQFVAVDVMSGEHRSEAFLSKNPSGAVPVLELEDGTFISECTAITEYIDHLHGDPTLTGKSAKERAIIHMMQRRVEAGLMDAVGTYFHHATPGLGPKLETYQNPEWGQKAGERAAGGMRYLDQILARQPYIAGDKFTMVDITAFAGLAFADYAKLTIPRELGHLAAWRERVGQRPSLKHDVL